MIANDLTRKKENDTILRVLAIAGGISTMGLIDSVYGKTLAFIGGFVVLFTIGFWISRQFLFCNIVDYKDFKKRKTDDIFITIGFQIEDILQHSNIVFRIVMAGLWIQALLAAGLTLVKFVKTPYPRDWILILFTIGCIVGGFFWISSAFLELKAKQPCFSFVSVCSLALECLIIVQSETLGDCIVYGVMVLIFSFIFQFALIVLLLKDFSSLVKKYAARLVVARLGFEYGFFLRMITKKGDVFDAEKDFFYPEFREKNVILHFHQKDRVLTWDSLQEIFIQGLNFRWEPIVVKWTSNQKPIYWMQVRGCKKKQENKQSRQQ